MKKVIVFIVLGVFVGMVCFSSVGCSGKKPEPVDSDSISAISDTTAADTLDQIIAETPMPSAADELFDDFFFNFAQGGVFNRRIGFLVPSAGEGNLSGMYPYVKAAPDENDFCTVVFIEKQNHYSALFGILLVGKVACNFFCPLGWRQF